MCVVNRAVALTPAGPAVFISLGFAHAQYAHAQYAHLLLLVQLRLSYKLITGAR